MSSADEIKKQLEQRDAGKIKFKTDVNILSGPQSIPVVIPTHMDHFLDEGELADLSSGIGVERQIFRAKGFDPYGPAMHEWAVRTGNTNYPPDLFGKLKSLIDKGLSASDAVNEVLKQPLGKPSGAEVATPHVDALLESIHKTALLSPNTELASKISTELKGMADAAHTNNGESFSTHWDNTEPLLDQIKARATELSKSKSSMDRALGDKMMQNHDELVHQLDDLHSLVNKTPEVQNHNTGVSEAGFKVTPPDMVDYGDNISQDLYDQAAGSDGKPDAARFIQGWTNAELEGSKPGTIVPEADVFKAISEVASQTDGSENDAFVAEVKKLADAKVKELSKIDTLSGKLGESGDRTPEQTGAALFAQGMSREDLNKMLTQHSSTGTDVQNSMKVLAGFDQAASSNIEPGKASTDYSAMTLTELRSIVSLGKKGHSVDPAHVEAAQAELDKRNAAHDAAVAANVGPASPESVLSTISSWSDAADPGVSTAQLKKYYPQQKGDVAGIVADLKKRGFITKRQEGGGSGGGDKWILTDKGRSGLAGAGVSSEGAGAQLAAAIHANKELASNPTEISAQLMDGGSAFLPMDKLEADIKAGKYDAQDLEELDAGAEHRFNEINGEGQQHKFPYAEAETQALGNLMDTIAAAQESKGNKPELSGSYGGHSFYSGDIVTKPGDSNTYEVLAPEHIPGNPKASEAFWIKNTKTGEITKSSPKDVIPSSPDAQKTPADMNIDELNRAIDKYSSNEYTGEDWANKLLDRLTAERAKRYDEQRAGSIPMVESLDSAKFRYEKMTKSELKSELESLYKLPKSKERGKLIAAANDALSKLKASNKGLSKRSPKS